MPLPAQKTLDACIRRHDGRYSIRVVPVAALKRRFRVCYALHFLILYIRC